jgi:hypothetical protein
LRNPDFETNLKKMMEGKNEFVGALKLNSNNPNLENA